MRQSIPGICEIGCLGCEQLYVNMEEKALCGLPVQVPGYVTPVTFVGMPGCVTESVYDNNGRSEKTTLTFCTTEQIEGRRHLAFVVRQNNGAVYVIGHREQPFPVVKVTRSSGMPESDRAVYTVEVTLVGRRTLIKTDAVIGP